MGLHSKRLKKAQDIDSDFEDFDEDMDNGNLTVSQKKKKKNLFLIFTIISEILINIVIGFGFCVCDSC